jgi:hypothetical protein
MEPSASPFGRFLLSVEIFLLANDCNLVFIFSDRRKLGTDLLGLLAKESLSGLLDPAKGYFSHDNELIVMCNVVPVGVPRKCHEHRFAPAPAPALSTTATSASQPPK